jgi:hypothetical protein
MTTNDTPAPHDGPQHHAPTAAAMNTTAVRTHCRWPVPFWLHVSRWQECRAHLIATFTTFISKELFRCCLRLRHMRPTTASPEGHG